MRVQVSADLDLISQNYLYRIEQVEDFFRLFLFIKKANYPDHLLENEIHAQ